MAGEGAVGRGFLIKRGGVALIGIRSVTLNKNDEPIDVTSGENDGWRCLLPESGTQSIDISFEGVIKNNDIQDVCLDPTVSTYLTDVELEYPIFVSGNTQPATMTCEFKLGPLENTMPMGDAITFSSTLQSSGIPVYTPEAP